MKRYSVNANFVEHELNGQKYLLKIEDSDIRYPKLYILNDSSYDIYSYIHNNENCTIEEIICFLKKEYVCDENEILYDDIEECVISFINAGWVISVHS